MSLKIGDSAPSFTLKNQNTEDISLNNFAGKNVLLLFFPFANTSVCTEEMCSMRDNMNQYAVLNAEIIGISVDSPFALKMWEEKHNINFHLLSDFNKEVSLLYNVLDEVFAPAKFAYKGVSKRAAFIIDTDGKIIYREICEHPGLQPDYEAIKSKLNSLKS